MNSPENLQVVFPPALPEGGVLVASVNNSSKQQVIEELSGRPHLVGMADGGADALQKLESGAWKTLLLDEELPDLDAQEVANLARRKYPKLTVRFLTSSALQATSIAPIGQRLTATEDSRTEQGLDPTRRCSPSLALKSETMLEPLPGMVGSSRPMLRVYELARRVATRSTTVLITGATGTGKDLVARAIHALSRRSSRPFVVVNCAAIPETLLESELFGYVRGAFTGAVQSQAGRIAAANGGTLFLDEVGELPLSTQAKLLRFIELKEIQRLGSVETSRIDVRIIAATNNDLARRVREKQFRQDLFYRLAIFSLELPVLCARVDDILPLARHFLSTLNGAGGAPVPSLSASAADLLLAHTWPGNVRELQLVLERACILSAGEDEIGPEHICFPAGEQPGNDERGVRSIAV